MREIKKYALILCTILLIQLITTLNAAAVNTNSEILQKQEYSIIVDKEGNGDYTSIQQAITYAKSGSTIHVKKGEYKEIIEIKKSLSLVGEDKESTLINPISKKNKYAICLGALDISISGFTITNKAPGLYSQGIKITSDYTKISNCNVYDTAVGIAVWTNNNIIKNCVFRGCKDEGIALLGSKKNPCNYNTISNCVFYNNCDAIEMQYSSENTISECEIYENTHSGIDAIASNNNKNTFSNCKIYNNQVHGIYLSSSKNNKIVDCTLKDNTDGDIIMNKYSTDNQIMNTDENNKPEDIKKSYLTNFFEFLSKFKTQRFQQIIDRLRF